MGPKFFETKMGKQFYDGTMPRIAAALERIAAALEAQTNTRATGIDALARKIAEDIKREEDSEK